LTMPGWQPIARHRRSGPFAIIAVSSSHLGKPTRTVRHTSNMNTALLVSLIAAVASIAAATVAIWQARVAGSQARSALRQAVSSEDQAQLMRTQLEDVRSEREQQGSRQRRDQIMEYVRNAKELNAAMAVQVQGWGALMGFESAELANQETDRQRAAYMALISLADSILRDLDSQIAERFSQIHRDIMESYSKFVALHNQRRRIRRISGRFGKAGAARKAEAMGYAKEVFTRAEELAELVD
jgi:uncharacterized protein HemX